MLLRCCRRSDRSHLICLFALGAAIGGCHAADKAKSEWPQWGGPNRNFIVETDGLADKWPDEGPKKLWHREPGDGYAAIVVDDGVLYTMYRKDEDEFAIGLDAATGRTLWEHRNRSPFTATMSQFGPGPHSTPLVAGERLFTVGTNSVIHCFHKKTGAVLWKHDLAKKFGAPVPQFGYSCSPIAYKNMVIVLVDRVRSNEGEDEGGHEGEHDDRAQQSEGQSLVAFDQESGRVVWKSLDFAVDYASPILINFDGQAQLVAILRREIIGVDPNDGGLLWHLPFTPVPVENIASPVWTGDDLLFFSAAYNSGSRAIKLTKKDGNTIPEELWYNRRLRVHHGNAIRVGDYVYGSSGDSSTTLFAAINIRTGKRKWVDRGLKKSTCVYADGKLIALDENGRLALATVTAQGLTVNSTCELTEHQSWTVPTLVGKTLYVRDRRNIMALDLG
ncbi:MAG: outer membrane protein assembly factor BamB family protein [Planctomycetota bacterium]|jgi:outer membrane protein assembly factor BamB